MRGAESRYTWFMTSQGGRRLLVLLAPPLLAEAVARSLGSDHVVVSGPPGGLPPDVAPTAHFDGAVLDHTAVLPPGVTADRVLWLPASRTGTGVGVLRAAGADRRIEIDGLGSVAAVLRDGAVAPRVRH